MRKWQKAFVVAAGFLVVIVVAGITTIRFFSATFFQDLLEENLNCRAQVRAVDTRIGFSESSLILSGVELWPRTGELDEPEVSVGEVELGVDFGALLRRRIRANRLVIREPKVVMRFLENGDLSLEDLFRSPDESDSSEKKEGIVEAHEKEESVPQSSSRDVLDAKNNRWLAELRETRIEGGVVEILLEKDDLRIEIADLGIELEELRFDPEKLETLNEVAMALSAQVGLFDKEDVSLVRLDLDGTVEGQLFDEQSGDFSADVEGDLKLGEQSFVSPKIKVVRRVWEAAQKVERVGIRLGELPDGFRFGRSERLSGHYRKGRVALLKPLSLGAGPWALGVGADSWIEAFSGRHELGVEFLLSENVSGVVGGWMEQLPKEVRGLAQKRFVDENQVLWVVKSEGLLEDPQLNFFSQLPEAKGLVDELEDVFKGDLKEIREEAEEEVKGLLKSLFGQDKD